MIQWTIPGSVLGLTGSSSFSSSSEFSTSDSSSEEGGNAPFLASISFSFSTTSSVESSAETIVSGFASTVRGYSSFTSAATYEAGTTNDLTPEAQSDEENSYDGPTVFAISETTTTSASDSNEDIFEFTLLQETSTTETYESNYVSTIATESVYFPWTISAEEGNSDETATFFAQKTEGETTTTVSFEFTTRQGTDTFVAADDDVVTLNGPPDTIIQAGPDEVIYVIRDMPSVFTGYAAATTMAESGTRFTLSPSFETIPKESMSASTPTTAAQYASYSTSVAFSRPAAEQTTITTASYFGFPPSTETLTVASFTLQGDTAERSEGGAQFSVGNGTTSTEVTSYATIPTIVMRQTQNLAYTASTSTTFSFAQFSTLLAAVTLSESSESYGLTSHAEGNTIVPVPVALLGNASLYGQIKYRTTGALVSINPSNTEALAGGWITADSSFSDVFGLYGLYGIGRDGRIVIPQTNSSRTVNLNSITWRTTTLSLGETAGTTTSAEFGVEGEPSITTDARPLTIFGGSPGAGCTFVERPGAGVYKDAIDGATSTFEQGDIVIIEGQSAPLKSYFPITHVGTLALQETRAPAFWTEPRNSTELPPNTPTATNIGD